jgi:hypothetical protein
MDAPYMDEEKFYANAQAALEACVKELYYEALHVAETYMQHVDKYENAAAGWGSRSTLQLSCTRKGNHLDLKWTGVKWYGSKANRKSIREAIPKNKETLSYSKAKLSEYAKDWEIDKVMETEGKLNIIRRKGTHIAKALVALANARRVLRANPEDQDASDVSSSED